MAEIKLSSSDTVLIAPAGSASPVGWQVIVSGSTDWVGSIVLKQNTAPPGSTRTLVSVALQNPNTGEEIAAGTAITASGARIVSPTGGDLYVVYTHTSGTVNVRANPATQGVTDNELETAFLAAGFETSGQDTPVTQLSAAVAMLLGQSLDVRAFGAVGDGVTDDTEAIQAAIDAADRGQLIVARDLTLRLDSALTISDKTVRFDFTGSTIDYRGDGHFLDYDAGLDFIRDVTTVDASAHTLEMDTTDVVPGDILKLVCDDRLEGTRPADGDDESRRGQYLTVFSVSETLVTFNENLRYTFTANVRCAKLSGHTISITGGTYACPAASVQEQACIEIYNAVRPELRGLSFGYLPFIAINLRGCYGYRVIAPSFVKQPFTPPAFGHGISDWSCYGGYVEHASGGYMRHVFTTNSQPIPADSDWIWAYGPSYGGHVVFGNASGEGEAAFDTHHGCEDFIFDGGIVAGRQGWGFSVRGRRITLNSPKCYGCEDGVQVYSETDMAEVDYSEDITINNPECFATADTPFQALRARRVVVNNPILETSGLLAVSVGAADVTMRNPIIRAAGNAVDSEGVFNLTNAAELRVTGRGSVTVDDHTGTNARIVKMTGTGACHFGCEYLDFTLNATMALTFFANGATEDGVFEVEAFRFLAGPTTITRTASSATFTDESYVRYWGVVDDPSARQFTTVTDTLVLTFGRAYDQHVLNAVTAAGNVTIGGIAAGKFPGQRLTLWTQTANDIVIPNGAGSNGVVISNFGGGSVTLTNAGECVTYLWGGDDSANGWIQVGAVA